MRLKNEDNRIRYQVTTFCYHSYKKFRSKVRLFIHQLPKSFRLSLIILISHCRRLGNRFFTLFLFLLVLILITSRRWNNSSNLLIHILQLEILLVLFTRSSTASWFSLTHMLSSSMSISFNIIFIRWTYSVFINIFV